jgi:hypothetical protein
MTNDNSKIIEKQIWREKPQFTYLSYKNYSQSLRPKMYYLFGHARQRFFLWKPLINPREFQGIVFLDQEKLLKFWHESILHMFMNTYFSA